MPRAIALRLAFVVTLLPAVGHADVPTLQALAERPHFDAVSMSPDGKHLAVSANNERGRSLLIVDADTMQPTAEMKFRAHSHVASFTWANNETLVVTRAQRFAGNGRNAPGNTGEIYSVSVDGSRQNILFGARTGQSKRVQGRQGDFAVAWVVDRLANDPDHILIGSYDAIDRDTLQAKPKLIRVNVDTGAREWVTDVPLQYPNVTTDSQGHVRFAYGLDEQRRSTTMRFDPGTGVWSTVDLGLGALGSVQPMGFSADDSEFYASLSEQGEAGCLYRINAATLQRKKLTCEAQSEPRTMMWSRQRGVPIAVTFEATGRRAHLLNPGSEDALLFKQLSRQFEPSSVHIQQVTEDGKRALFWVVGDREPGRAYLFDRAKSENRLVFDTYPGLDAEQLGPLVPFAMTARDGTPLHGFLTLPPDRAAKDLPLVVMPHGGPYGVADRWTYDSTAQVLATRGYAVLKVNFRGSGGHGEIFLRQGYRQWGLAIQDDIVDATRWVIAQGVADGKRVCIVGASFGAYSAMMSAAREPELFRCAVGMSGVYELGLMFRHGDIMRTKEGRAYLDEVLGKDEAQLAEQSPAAQAARIRADVLLVHGDADARAPLAHAKALARALEKAGVRHELWVVPNEGHGIYKEDNRVRYYQRLLEFLEQHLTRRPSLAG